MTQEQLFMGFRMYAFWLNHILQQRVLFYNAHIDVSVSPFGIYVHIEGYPREEELKIFYNQWDSILSTCDGPLSRRNESIISKFLTDILNDAKDEQAIYHRAIHLFTAYTFLPRWSREDIRNKLRQLCITKGCPKIK